MLTMPRVREEESREMLGSLAECLFFYSRREKGILSVDREMRISLGVLKGFPHLSVNLL